MPEAAAPVARPKRRLRVSLRGLMVFVLIVGTGLGWMIHRARVQKEAVAAIERAGGDVVYDWDWANGRRKPRPQATPPWPKWLLVHLGPDYLGNVVQVNLYSRKGA